MALDPHLVTSLTLLRVNNFLGETTSGGGDSDETSLGKTFYVNNATSGLLTGAVAGADNANVGTSPLLPFATIDFAIGQCTASRGDKIVVLAGHSETLTAAITLDVAGVTIQGEGRGTNRPQITVNGTVDGITVTAANCKVENLYFNEATAAATASINVAAANTKISRCHFDMGANDGTALTWASGAQLVVEDCVARVTADGPNDFMTIEAANDGLIMKGNLLDGGSSTNTWDDAAVDMGSTAPTNCLLTGNVFIYGTATVSTGNAALKMVGNAYLGLAIPKAGVTKTIYADPSGTTTSDGTEDDPTTLANAISAAGAGDRILLYPGSYTLTAAQALNDAQVYLGPVHRTPGQQNVIVTTATADINLFDVTAAGVIIEGLRFTNTATVTTQTELIDIDSGGDQCLINDCTFDFAAAANVEGVNIATGVADVTVSNCKFVLPNAGESCILHAGSQTRISNNVFDLSGGDGLALEQLASPGDGTVIDNNLFMADGTATVMMSWQSTPGAGHAIVRNLVTDQAGTTAVFGDDTDLDFHAVSNFQGSTAGAEVAIDPSVT